MRLVSFESVWSQQLWDRVPFLHLVTVTDSTLAMTSRHLKRRQLGRRQSLCDLSGHRGLADVPVQVPGLNPVTLGTVRDVLRALQVQNGEALGALGDAFQVEGVDRVAVPADLTDEALALAEDAVQDVLATESGGMAQQGLQLAGTNLFLQKTVLGSNPILFRDAMQRRRLDTR